MPVSVVNCANYEENEVYQGVRQSVELLGGLGKFISPGQKVALKPNMVMRKDPLEAATTHPLIVKAVVRLVQEAGAEAIICESPGGPYTPMILRDLYKKCGMQKVAEETGCQLNDDTEEHLFHHLTGQVVKQLPILKPLIEADLVINLPKLKTHAMTLYSGAVKNMYGSIPGMKKAEFHFQMSDPKVFANLLVDVFTAVQPALTIMDAIWGMEGDGPTAGQPKPTGLIIASENAFDIDALCIEMIGLRPEEIWTCQHGLKRGLQSDSIQLVGSTQLPRIKYKLPKSRQVNFADELMPAPIARQVNRLLQPRLYFSPEMCVGCGECANCCPAQALTITKGLPQLTQDKCIRCYCCQELCPKKAVHIKKTWLARKLFGE